MGDRSDDFDKWDDRLKRIEDLQRGWGGRDFVDFDGETNLSPELEFAISTFVRLRYRNFDVWEVCKTYSFAAEETFPKILKSLPSLALRDVCHLVIPSQPQPKNRRPLIVAVSNS